ncbi:MAG: hypothetical protein M1832_006142 [Thelocarpon impressellum]|nr:MAG: hypothetical protein M1832_006142 [Thelocarpon impressellum]
MLKTKNLNKLLSQNTSAAATALLVLTPAGTLLAYSTPAAPPTTLRSQATLAATIWASYSAHAASTLPAALLATGGGGGPGGEGTRGLRTLDLELASALLSLRRLHSGLLLCLLGPAARPPPPPPTRRPASPTAAPETASPRSSTPTPPLASSAPSAPSASPPQAQARPLETDESSARDMDAGVERGAERADIALLRARGKTLAEWLDRELEAFVMPPGS